MKREQRFRSEMFVRVRDYGTAHKDLFPESSTGGHKFAQVTAAVAAIDGHLENRVVADADARGVKAEPREVVFAYRKTLAQAGRRITRPEAGQSRFRMPRRRTLKAEISTARVFIEEAAQRQEQFVKLGLPPTFISDFTRLVDTFQQVVDARLSSKTVRREALAGIDSTLARGLDVIRDLDIVVAIATQQDPNLFASYQSARRIDGLSPSSRKAAEPPAVPPVAVPPEAPPSAATAAATDTMALVRAGEEVLDKAS